MGVSAGGGMIHFVLLTRDEVGRNVVDSRVIEVDESDGLDAAGRVNAGIDLLLTAAREEDLRVGPIGVTARTGGERRRLRSRGSGPRRQIRLVTEEESTVAYLCETGQIERFDSVVVADIGDTGMSLYTVEPSSGRVGDVERSDAMSGRQLDRALADAMSARATAVGESSRSRVRRSALLSACRTAKEEIVYGSSDTAASSVAVAEGSGRLSLTESAVESAAAAMVDEARKALHQYLAGLSERGMSPEAVVLVGGLANLPVTQRIVDDPELEIICPPSPELVPATGAAILAQQNRSGAARLAFIGGHRNRKWLSATPLAVAGAIIAAALMTVYAVTSSLTGRHVPEPTPQPASTTIPSTSVADTSPVATTTRYSLAPVPLPPTDLPTVTPLPPTETGWTDPPGWATTELTPTSTPTTTTRTLSPFPLPSSPFGSTPPIPPGLLPPGLFPFSTTRTPPPPVSPSRSPNHAPGTRTTPKPPPPTRGLRQVPRTASPSTSTTRSTTPAR